MSSNNFEFNREIFTKALDSIFEQLQKKEGLFREDPKKLLPQWNLPSEFEYSPIQNKPKKPLETSIWLWGRMFCDRKSKSSVLMKNALNAWEDKNLRWIFLPKEIVKRNPEEIKEGLKLGFEYSFSHPNEKSIKDSYLDNAKKLILEYDSDPRNLINEKTVEEARKNIMEFDKFGTGLANLYIIELISRSVAMPTDPKNALVKIDVHRERFPLSIGAITTDKKILHHGYAISFLEKEYLNYYKKKGLTVQEMIDMDHAVWTIGSEVCAKQNIKYCKHLCSLEKICNTVPRTSKNGKWTIRENEKIIDIRKGDKNQLSLF